jgi:hypothetical protein
MRVRSVAELVHLVERVGILGELTISIRSSDLNGKNPQRFPAISAGNEMSPVHAR